MMRRVLLSSPAPRGARRRDRRGVTLVASVILSLIACTVAMVLVQQALAASRSSSDSADSDLTDRIAEDVIAQFEAKLADDPLFYTRELFFAERPRMCDTGSGLAPVVASVDPQAPATPWPATCPTTWSYLPMGSSAPGYDPSSAVTRVEIVTPSATSSALRLRVLVTVGAAESAVDKTYTIPSAAQLTLYSQTGVDLDQLAGATGTVSLSGTVYTVEASTTPSRAEHTTPEGVGPLTGARLVSECGFSGPQGGAATFWRALGDADRAAVGCVSIPADPVAALEVRDLAPAALSIDNATRSLIDLTSGTCPSAPTPVSVSAPAPDAGAWSSSLCLRSGATVVLADGSTTTVTAAGQPPAAYRLQFEGDTANAVVRVFVAATPPTDPATLSEATSDYLAGTHALSSPGVVWAELGALPLPQTGVIGTDATTYVGSCTAALTGAGSCVAAATARDVTVVAGTPATPADIVIAGPVGAGADANLGLIATGRIRIPFYAHPAGGDLTLAAHLFALGSGAATDLSIATTADPANPGATFALTGSLGGATIGPLAGFTRVQIAPSLTSSPPRFVTFSPYWRSQTQTTPTPAQLCGQLSCATSW